MQAKELICYHTNNKYLYFCFSIQLKDKLGRIVSEVTKDNVQEKEVEYFKVRDELFKLKPTINLITNSFSHMFGYYSKYLSKEEKEEFILLLKKFKDKEIRSVVVQNSLKESIVKYDIKNLINQSILNYEFDV